MKKTIFFSLMAAALAASCNKPVQMDMDTDLRIEVSTVPTKSIIETQKLPSGSEIGLFLAEKDKATYDDLSYANVKYTASGEDASQVWNPERSVYLSTTNGTVSAYFPYSSTVTDITAIPVETASQTDYMWATQKDNVNNTSATVPLTMNHALAAVRVTIKKGTYTGPAEVTDLYVQSDGLTDTAILDATDGTLSGFGLSQGISPESEQFTITATPTEKTILVIPNNQSQAICIKLNIDGKPFEAETTAMQLTAGTITIFNLTLNSEIMTLDGVSVTPWGETDKGSLDLEIDPERI